MPPEQWEPGGQRQPDESAMPPELMDGDDAVPAELRPVYSRLLADARAWRATAAPAAPLVAYIRSLPYRVPRGREEATAMDMPPDQRRPFQGERVQRLASAFHIAQALPAVAAAILIVALLGGALYALSAKHGPGSATAAATPTTTISRPTPSPTLALPPAGQGWTKAGPAYFYGTVAAAPSQPTTLYSCGQRPSANGDPSAPSYLGVSHDGGKTWQSSPLPAYCATLSVSPANPRDVAFTGTVCGSASGCLVPPGAQSWVYLSMDGGAHWTLAKLPTGSVDPSFVPLYHFAWAGTTLFVAPTIVAQAPTSGKHILAASANGGPFVWVDQNGLRSSVQSDAAIDGLIGAGESLYVDLTLTNASCAGSTSSSACSAVAKTTDGGSSWASITSTYQGTPMLVTAGAPSGALLAHPRAASYITGPMLRSTDGGATWSTLPALPGGLSPQDTATFETADGTIFVEANTHPNPIFELLPGANAWVLVAPAVNDAGSGDLAAVSWDANGHPLLLWESALGEGLFTHPA